MTDATYEGGCFCGAVRYRVTGEPSSVEYCHCSMCRKTAGAPVVAWMDLPPNALAWIQGRPKEFASSEKALRSFCGDCGTPLTFRFRESGGRLSLTVCSLDNPQAIAPRQHIFHDDRLSWLELSDSLPRHAGRGAHSS